MKVRRDGRMETTCKEMVELASDYLEGALPATEAEVTEEHLSRCPGCAAYLAQLRLMLRLVSRDRS